MVVQEAADVLHWQAGGLKVEKGKEMGWPLEGMMVAFRGQMLAPALDNKALHCKRRIARLPVQ